MVDGGRASDGLFSQMDIFPTVLTLAGAEEKIPADRYIDGVDQTSFLLAPGGDSNRKYQYYWLGRTFSALRVGEYKFMVASISDDDRDVLNPGGFTGVSQRYPYGRLYNLYLDPKETRSYSHSQARLPRVIPERRAQPLRHLQEVSAKVVVGLGG